MKALGIVLVIIFLVFPLFMFSGFIWMICLGALSHIFNVPRLAISYWQSVLVAFIVWLLIGGIRGSD